MSHSQPQTIAQLASPTKKRAYVFFGKKKNLRLLGPRSNPDQYEWIASSQSRRRSQTNKATGKPAEAIITIGSHEISLS